MPQVIGLALASFVSNTAAAIGLSVAAQATAAAFAASLGSVVFGVALSIGANLLLNRQSGVRPSDGQQEIKQPLSPRLKSFGTVRVSGIVWFLDTNIVTAGGTHNFLYYGIALNHGRISEFVSFHINEKQVALSGSDEVTTPPFDTDDNFLYSRLGAATETAYSQLETAFGLTEMRGDGVATILAKIESPATVELFQTAFPDGRPLIRATIDSSVVWDPRDSAQSRTDNTTWEFSDNPVVCLLTYLIDADGYGMPYERIEGNLAEWIAAMNTCDEQVDLSTAGATESRYRLAMTFSLTDNPKDVADRILTSCDGKIWARRDGTIGIAVGEFVEPTVTIFNRDILAYGEMTRGQDPLFALAGIRAQYMSPLHDYREHEAEPWPTGDAVLALSEDRTVALDLTMVPSRTQTRRLMKRVYVRETAGWRGTICTNLAGLRAIDERFINVQIDELGIDESFEVGRFTSNPDGTIELEIRAVDATIDDWTPATEEGSEAGFGFSYASKFTVTGTAVDPLVDAGGVAGQAALVCVSVGGGSSVSATPAGWTEIQRDGPISSQSLASFIKVLDGSETSTTFLAASGAIIVILFEQAPGPTTTDLDIQITSGVPTDQTKEAIAQPYAVVMHAMCNANKSDDTWADLYSVDSASALTPDASAFISTGASMSGVVKLIVYGPDETPEGVYASMPDSGTNGLQSFILHPGV